MNQLIIKLTGTIQSSNFNEWKNDLIAQVQSINTELTTDDDFVVATRHVKLFKAAEKSLKEAKQSALEQAADIQTLFSAIDEVSEETRQARLSLERQIKARKLEIKDAFIQSGIEMIGAFIDQQSDDFQLIDHSSYLERSRFESAARGKAGTKGIQFSINSLCNTIKQEIMQKTIDVKNNGITIDTLSSQYKVLFQDRNSLLALPKQQLELTVDKRIALFNEENTRIKAEKTINDLKKREDLELNPDANLQSESTKILQKGKYRLIIDILSTKDTAIEIARSIRQSYDGNTSISNIKLTRDHD